MPSKKVQRDQRPEITAEAYNAFIDAALAVREHKQFRHRGVAILPPEVRSRSRTHRVPTLGLGRR